MQPALTVYLAHMSYVMLPFLDRGSLMAKSLNWVSHVQLRREDFSIEWDKFARKTLGFTSWNEFVI